MDGGLLQRRVGSLEENMSVRSNDVRAEPIAGPSRPAMASQQGQSFLRDALHEIVRGLENGGSGNYQATRRAQFSAPSNMGVEHSSRGGMKLSILCTKIGPTIPLTDVKFGSFWYCSQRAPLEDRYSILSSSTVPQIFHR